MQDTNFEITPVELNAMMDSSFFDLKTGVMEKISRLLNALKDALEANKLHYESFLPAGIMDQQGKISKGENYLGYPYLVMDFPRVFEKENIFAFRSMFWWGKHFSYTLHVGGIFFDQSKNNFIKNFYLLQQPGIYICVNENPWEYHFENHNYTAASNMDVTGITKNKSFGQDFIKLSLRTELSHWNQVKTDGLRAFELFTEMLF